jgi:predicted HTH transcriptional regulator
MPPRSGNILDQARSLIERRIKDLEDEKTKLERTLADLTDGRAGRRRPGRPRGSTARRRGRKRGRKRTTRSDQAVKVVSENPGITASEIAKRLKIKPNYMYRVMGELQGERRVSKRGRGYYPA